MSASGQGEGHEVLLSEAPAKPLIFGSSFGQMRLAAGLVGSAPLLLVDLTLPPYTCHWLSRCRYNDSNREVAFPCDPFAVVVALYSPFKS